MADGDDTPHRLTIRVGTDVFDDVQDYVVLVRTKEGDVNVIRSRTSSYAWAHGAMEATIALINAHNINEASGDDGGEE